MENQIISAKISFNLESLLKLSNLLNSSTDKNYILNSALLSIMGKLRILRAGIFEITTDDKNAFSLTIRKGKAGNTSFTFDNSQISQPYYIIHNTENDSIKFDNPVGNSYAVAFTLSENNLVKAIICLGSRIDNQPFTTEEMQYAELICRIAETALCNADNITNLNRTTAGLTRKNQLLSSIFEMNRDFSAFLNREQILRILSYRLMGQLMISKFGVYLIDENHNYDAVVNRFDSEFSTSALDEIFSIKESTLLKNFNFSRNSYLEINKLKAKAFVPMIIHSEKRGCLIIGKKLNGEDFTPENFSFIEALANNAIAALENERLVREEIKKKSLENELSLALEIQRNLLPADVPQLSDSSYSIAGNSLPSRAVGGDYFDYIKLDENRTLICIADVSGKGIPASLIMANVQAGLHTLASLELSLNDIVTRINSLVYSNTSSDRFVTFFIGCLDTSNDTFSYINAGHNPPIFIRSDGKLETFDVGGLLLGIFPGGVPYESAKVSISSNELICFYTDGITEAPSAEGEEYGEERLAKYLDQNRGFDAEEILNGLIREVQIFSAGDTQYDDLTAVIIKKK